MDIGRHNALDKIYGYCLRNNIRMEDKIIVFSGRISSEILLKVSKIGCAIVLSKSAPTELALQLAEQTWYYDGWLYSATDIEYLYTPTTHPITS